MNQDSYKAWIDAMPIDDVRRRIERLERKLSDLHVLERLYEDRHGDGAGESEPSQAHGHEAETPPAEGEGWSREEPAAEHG
ncbi:MAG TPA: hypothetical protein VN740_05895 [Solirubrobacteraceae bacterium]|nr:hypothetical protein [Solirubrobacteraceae bacterium]